MSKADLKAAMESLQVKKPLRLQRPAPSFAPPVSAPVESTLVTNPTLVGNTTQVQNPTLVEDQTGVRNPTPVATQTLVENETMVAKATPVENPTPVQIPTPVAKSTQVVDEPSSTEDDSATLTRRVTEQDSSVVLEARAADGLERGYTRLPNSVLMQLASGDFTRNEIKLALLVARFTISFQRKLAPLSKMVLERRSGLRGAAVLEALSGLVTKGLIEKQQGDQHRPNMLGLVLPADWEALTKPKRDAESTPVANPAPAPVGKAAPAEVGNPTYFKDIKIYKNNSLSDLPVPLQKYFDELKPAKKREAEWQAFESLQGDYKAEDISECLELLQERGIKRRGPNGEESQPCHSPMAYLSKAMGEVFAEIQLRREKARERVERERRDAESIREHEENQAREAAEWAVKERAFVEALPEEERQNEVITELLGNLPIRPNSRVGRTMGIGLWWSQNQSQDITVTKPVEQHTRPNHVAYS